MYFQKIEKYNVNLFVCLADSTKENLVKITLTNKIDANALCREIRHRKTS